MGAWELGKEQPSKSDSIAKLEEFRYCTQCQRYHKTTTDIYLKHKDKIQTRNGSLDDFDKPAKKKLKDIWLCEGF